jgi:esterase FrsA
MMSYEWPQEPEPLFAERFQQMLTQGIPEADAQAVRSATTDMWPDAPGGWVHEWSQLAARYDKEGKHLLAAQAYGWAHFPTLADQPKRTALAKQLEQYQLAAPEFSAAFERRELTLPYDRDATTVPIHILAQYDLPEHSPVMLFSGGVDSWKMDLHNMIMMFVRDLPVRVIAFDLPGTGESQVHLGRPGTKVIDGLVQTARSMTDGLVVHVGFSFGAYFASYSGLSGIVDGAVSLGGPVDQAFSPDRTWAYGMADIVGNALGYDQVPSPDDLSERVATMSLHDLLDQDINAPMLAINGADDVHVPQQDTLVFDGRRNCTAQLIPNTGHCCSPKRREAVATIIEWLADLGLR